MKAYANLPLRSQLTIPLVLMITALLILAGVSWNNNKQLTEHVDQLLIQITPASLELLNGDRDLYQSAIGLRDALTAAQDGADPAKFIDGYTENQQQALDRMMHPIALATAAGLPNANAHQRAFEASFQQWKASADKVVALINSNQLTKAQELLMGEQNQLFSSTRDFYDKFEGRLDEFRHLIADETVVIEKEQLTHTLYITCVTILIGLFFLIWLPKSLIERLDLLKSKMQELSQSGGDLTLRLPEIGNNELSQLARSTNQFLSHLQALLLKVNNEVVEIKDRSASIHQVSADTQTHIHSQSRSLQEMVDAVSELNSAISEVATQSQNSADEANQSKGDIEKSHQDIQLAVEKMRSLLSDMETAAQVVSRLEQDSHDITSVIDVIGGIAEQTNLLALNAAIEAARAGDSGRGFAVVADEVRQLAQKTQQSTQSIQDMLERLNKGVSEAVNVIDSSSKRASETSTYTESAGEAMNLINSRVNTITDFSMQIAAATEQQSAVVSQVDSNMELMNQQGEQVTQGSAKVNRAIEDVSTSIEKLSQQIGVFKLS
ncbi:MULTISPECIES: methyl-accepting chemotaxis protein [unclassified Vibrio]|uniref:Methyl-accepting chemotaxis protein n=1 Tax=Vibrio sp. HB236076 TaxID=3232307 RepID=A0AB39HK63_9VIBR|nr:methyl-accepting chemotaxis protein [Vibrio sp. HB161653]MDP5252608.1 methyl-accepting chemotaxis protein [Vibrio sp. HB161653]